MAECLEYKNTGYKYVRGAEKVLFSNGIALTVEEFEQYDADNTVVREILARDKNGDRKFDFAHAVIEGQLRELRVIPEAPNVPIRRIRLPRSRAEKIVEDVSTEEPVAPMPAMLQLAEEVPSPTSGSFSSSFANAKGDDSKPPTEPPALPYWRTVPGLVTIVTSVVAAGSAVMSCYHTTLFIYTSGKPLWASLITGLIMIFFSATAFTSARNFFKERDATVVLGFIFMLLGLGVISYSMFSTITINFNQYTWEEQKEVAVRVENSAELAMADEARELMLREVQRLDGEIERLKEEAEGWRNMSWRRYDEYVQRIDDTLAKRDDAWAAYLMAGESRVVAESRVAQDRGTIYSFISSLLKVPEEVLRFLVYVIPAVFFDVAAPFGFTVILLLEDRRKKYARSV